jgi:hypothetical protein
LLQEVEIELAARALVRSADDALQPTGSSEMSARASAEGSRASI